MSSFNQIKLRVVSKGGQHRISDASFTFLVVALQLNVFRAFLDADLEQYNPHARNVEQRVHLI